MPGIHLRMKTPLGYRINVFFLIAMMSSEMSTPKDRENDKGFEGFCETCFG